MNPTRTKIDSDVKSEYYKYTNSNMTPTRIWTKKEYEFESEQNK